MLALKQLILYVFNDSEWLLFLAVKLVLALAAAKALALVGG